MTFLVAWSVVAVGQSQATVTLIDGNSVTQFEPTTQAGQFLWTVDGQNQLAQQWFWFRVGTAPEQSIDTISAPVITTPTVNSFTAVYSNAQVQITTTYTLIGGAPGDGVSDLAEQIAIKNLTGSSLDFHFFQYVDFDLNGSGANDVVYFANQNTSVQSSGSTSLAETVDTTNGAASTHREVNIFPNTLNALNDAFATTLNDNLGPLGPADVTWAFQWDFVIPAGSTRVISKDKNLAVPEPTSLGLLAAGGLMLVRRRKSA